MSTASEIAALREELAEERRQREALQAFVERLPHAKDIRLQDQRARLFQESLARQRAFESAEPAERLAMFAGMTDVQQREIVERVDREKWVAILAETAPADRRAYLAAMRVSPKGTPVARYAAFEIGSGIPPVVDLSMTASGVSIDVMADLVLYKGTSRRFLGSEWDRIKNDPTYGERVRAMLAAGAIAVTPVPDAEGRRFVMRHADYQKWQPDICAG